MSCGGLLLLLVGLAASAAGFWERTEPQVEVSNVTVRLHEWLDADLAALDIRYDVRLKNVDTKEIRLSPKDVSVESVAMREEGGAWRWLIQGIHILAGDPRCGACVSIAPGEEIRMPGVVARVFLKRAQLSKARRVTMRFDAWSDCLENGDVRFYLFSSGPVEVSLPALVPGA